MIKTLRDFSLLEWLFLLGQLLGSAVVALNLGHNAAGYCLFLVASVSGILLFRKTPVARSVLIINVYFAVVNTIGIIRYSI